MEDLLGSLVLEHSEEFSEVTIMITPSFPLASLCSGVGRNYAIIVCMLVVEYMVAWYCHRGWLPIVPVKPGQIVLYSILSRMQCVYSTFTHT